MLRTVQHVVHAAFFHLAAGVHHDDALAHLGDDAQVVRDQHDGRAQAGLDVAQQVQDLRLDGDVQRGGGLVGDQYLGLARQRHGDHGALTHAAGQLIGIFAHAARGVRDLHQLQQLLGLRQGVAARQPLVQHERFADLLAHRDHGVQGGHGLLVDH
ncbi:hypothetical protein G6F24_015688 [Rhizopus arrhizus]|nr:hypothetical protein G6F24_015688 [Rhizopus arrhizus]